MSDMVERVANALDARRLEMALEPGRSQRAYSLELARAAIAAMRDPTDVMVRAAQRVEGHRDENWDTEEAHAARWGAMVDAAFANPSPADNAA